MRAEVTLELDDGTEYTAQVEIERGDQATSGDAQAEAYRVLTAASSAVECAAGIPPQRYVLGVSS